MVDAIRLTRTIVVWFIYKHKYYFVERYMSHVRREQAWSYRVPPETKNVSYSTGTNLGRLDDCGCKRRDRIGRL